MAFEGADTLQAGSVTGSTRDSSLQQWLGSGVTTWDACAVEFDVSLSATSRLGLRIIFASSESPINGSSTSIFNDALGVFVDGNQIAVSPGTSSSPVTFNALRDAGALSQASDPFHSSQLAYSYVSSAFQVASSSLSSGSHHFKLVIADVGDASYDSAVLTQLYTLSTSTATVNLTTGSSANATLGPYGGVIYSVILQNEASTNVSYVIITVEVSSLLQYTSVSISRTSGLSGGLSCIETDNVLSCSVTTMLPLERITFLVSTFVIGSSGPVARRRHLLSVSTSGKAYTRVTASASSGLVSPQQVVLVSGYGGYTVGSSEPSINVGPQDQIEMDAVVGLTSDPYPLTILNYGSGQLTWNISSRPVWIRTSLNSGTLQPNESVVVQIVADATALTVGAYNSLISIASNDPLFSSVSTSLNLTVLAITTAIADIQPLVIQHIYLTGTSPSLLTSVKNITIRNNGTAPLRWSVVNAPAWLSLNPSTSDPISLPVTVSATFNATSVAGSYSNNTQYLWFTTSDPLRSNISVLAILNITALPSMPLNVQLSNVTKYFGVVTCSAALSWTAPADPGSAPVLQYAVFVRQLGGSYGNGTLTNDSTPWFNVTNLVPGKTYFAMVKAISSIGTGNSSAEASTLIAVVPYAPTSVGLVNLTRSSVRVTWTYPSDDGGMAVFTYVVYKKIGINGTFDNGTTINCTGNCATGNQTFSALTSGLVYYFSVSAINVVGEGFRTAQISSMAAEYATPPINLFSQNVTKTSVILKWTSPLDSGGIPIIDYVLYTQTGVGLFDGGFSTGGTNATTFLKTGLVAGYYYTFMVAGRTAFGIGAQSTSLSVFAAVVPSSPYSLYASFVGVSSMLLTWSAPLDSGGFVIQKYIVFTKVGSGSYDNGTMTASNAPSMWMTSLTSNATYTFKVQAVTQAGNGSDSSPLSRETYSLPSTPVAFNASIVTGAMIQTSWQPPFDSGGSDLSIFSYILESSTSTNFTVSGQSLAQINATGFLVEGLTRGQQYYVRVMACNVLGCGPATSALAVIAISVPSAPTSFTISWITSSSATLKWPLTLDSGDGTMGGTATTYSVELSTDQLSWSGIYQGSTNSTTYSPLLPSVQYYMRLAAWNSVGSSAYVTMTVPSVPGGPQAFTFSAGVSLNAYLSWNTPANSGDGTSSGVVVSSYEVDLSTLAAFTSPTIVVASTNLTQYPVSGLIAGQLYYFRVAGTNARGQGNWTITSGTVYVTPGQPTVLALTSLSASMLLASWNAPSSSGGLAILKYAVSWKCSSCSAFTTPVYTSNNASTALNVTGLISGITYNVSVCAVNSVGVGSCATALETPAGPPEAPSGLMPISGSVSTAQVGLQWTAPRSALPIARYRLCSSLASGAGNKTCLDTPTNASSYSFVTGLSSGTSYSITVSAQDTRLQSGPDASITIKTLGTPTAPVNFALQGFTRSTATFSWDTPLDDGGSFIIDYVLFVALAASPFPPTGTSLGTTANQATIYSGLVSGSLYKFQLAAQSFVGVGNTSAVLTQFIAELPSAPNFISYNNTGPTSTLLLWAGPADTGGAPILNYTIAEVSSALPTIIASRNTTITGLIPGANYTFIVNATNGLGTSPLSAPISFTAGVIPSAPSTLNVSSVGRTSAYLSWTTPAINGPAAVSYVIQGLPWSPVDVPASRLYFKATGLLAAAIYTVSVYAKNMFGAGPPSPAAIISTSQAVSPLAPSNLVVSAALARGANFTWSAPEDYGGSPILAYVLQTASSGTYYDSGYRTGTSQTNFTLYGAPLAPHTQYNISVAAVNAIGQGPFSPSILFTTAGAGPPGPPTLLTVQAVTKTSVTLKWLPPLQDNGNPPQVYTVYYYVGYNVSNPVVTRLNVTASPATISGFSWNTKLTVWITATNMAGESTPTSAIMTVTALPTVPSAPLNIRISSITQTSSVLNWTAPLDDGGGGFSLTYTIVLKWPASNATFTSTPPSLQLTALIRATQYQVVVMAVNSVGTGPPSSVAIFTTNVDGCGIYTNPASCMVVASCGWCSATVSCYNGSATGPYNLTCACSWYWNASAYDTACLPCSCPCQHSGVCNCNGSCTCPYPFAGSTCSTCLYGISDTTSFVQLPSSSSSSAVPSPRFGHSMAVLNGAMLLFGGETGSVSNVALDPTLWQLNLTTNGWSKRAITTVNRPGGRSGHTAVTYQNSMYVFGGRGNSSVLLDNNRLGRDLNDLWSFDTLTNAWTLLSPYCPGSSGATQLCALPLIDLVFVVDGACVATNGSTCWPETLTFVSTMINGYMVSPWGVHVAIIQASSNATISLALTGDLPYILWVLQNLPQQGGVSAVGEGLDLAAQEISRNGRSGCVPVVIVIAGNISIAGRSPAVPWSTLQSLKSVVYGFAVNITATELAILNPYVYAIPSYTFLAASTGQSAITWSCTNATALLKINSTCVSITNPSPRTLHSAVLLQSQMLVYGGYISTTSTLSSELWSYSLLAANWSLVSSGGPPQGRYSHSAVVSGVVMYIYGGMDAVSKIYNDVWAYNSTSTQWASYTSTLFPSSWRPWGSARHSAVLTPSGSGMIVSGGLGNRFDSQVLMDVWQYTFSNSSWLLLESPSVMRSRQGHGSVAVASQYYCNTTTLILFGGLSNWGSDQRLNDLWGRALGS